MTYVAEKAAKSVLPWRKYLERANLVDFDLNQFMAMAQAGKTGGRVNGLPKLGFAFSGGGVRALCLGAAVIEAFDGRNEKAVEARVGGIIQLANYACGLSG